MYLKRTSISTGGLNARASYGSSAISAAPLPVSLPVKQPAPSIDSPAVVALPAPVTKAPIIVPAAAAAPTLTPVEEEEDFTLLMGMDEDDSSGDEEVLEEG